MKRYLIPAIAVLFALLSWYQPMTAAAEASAEAGLTRALASFAAARTLNGVISVAQGTEVAVHPVGVGVSLTVGEILDPVNDLVESLSSVLLAASVAFGIEKLLLSLGAGVWVSVLVTITAIAWAALFAMAKAPPWLTRLTLALLFVRFAIPVALIGSESVFEHLSSASYAESQASIEGTSAELKSLTADTAPAETDAPPTGDDGATASSGLTGWFSDLGDAAQRAKDGMVESVQGISAPTEALRAKFDSVKNLAEQSVRRMIDLMIIFVMQTIVTPILLLWLMYRLLMGASATFRQSA